MISSYSYVNIIIEIKLNKEASSKDTNQFFNLKRQIISSRPTPGLKPLISNVFAKINFFACCR